MSSSVEKNNTVPTYEETVQIMKNRDNNPDIDYTDFGTSYDDNGEFIKIKTSSSTARADGGSGTLRFVNIYQDGEVIESDNGNFDSNKT